MVTLDEWAAEQCGVKIGKNLYYLPNGKRYLYPFTLQDARCLMICVRHWHISVWWDEVGAWHASRSYFEDSEMLDYEGAEPEDAIRACISEIREASDETNS